MGFYSDYPGHGDHSCWWNNASNRCEVGGVCRDKTFSFFELFGSHCPACQDCPQSEPQWSIDALRSADLPDRFYVNPADEYLWCAPRGSPGDCDVNRNQSICEMSYADHSGDKNCVWKGGRCSPGAKCDNARERVDAARKLGLQYYSGAWRRYGIPISFSSDYNNNNNRAGIGSEPARVLAKELVKGFSQGFKNCLKTCKLTNMQSCVKDCVVRIR